MYEGIHWLVVAAVCTVVGIVAYETLSPMASVGLAVMILAIVFAYLS